MCWEDNWKVNQKEIIDQTYGNRCGLVLVVENNINERDLDNIKRRIRRKIKNYKDIFPQIFGFNGENVILNYGLGYLSGIDPEELKEEFDFVNSLVKIDLNRTNTTNTIKNIIQSKEMEEYCKKYEDLYEILKSIKETGKDIGWKKIKDRILYRDFLFNKNTTLTREINGIRSVVINTYVQNILDKIFTKGNNMVSHDLIMEGKNGNKNKHNTVEIDVFLTNYIERLERRIIPERNSSESLIKYIR